MIVDAAPPDPRQGAHGGELEKMGHPLGKVWIVQMRAEEPAGTGEVPLYGFVGGHISVYQGRPAVFGDFHTHGKVVLDGLERFQVPASPRESPVPADRAPPLRGGASCKDELRGGKGRT